MHKDELLDLHHQLVAVKDHLLQYNDVTEEDFAEYDELGIGPDDTHEPKIKHRLAIFTLGSDLSATISDDDMSDAHSVSNRMEELAENTSAKL